MRCFWCKKYSRQCKVMPSGPTEIMPLSSRYPGESDVHMAKFPASLPRSRLVKPRSREPSQSTLSYENIENFTKELEIRRARSRRPGQHGQRRSLWRGPAWLRWIIKLQNTSKVYELMPWRCFKACLFWRTSKPCHCKGAFASVKVWIKVVWFLAVRPPYCWNMRSWELIPVDQYIK